MPARPQPLEATLAVAFARAELDFHNLERVDQRLE